MTTINEKLDQLLQLPEPPPTLEELTLQCYMCKKTANVGRPGRIKSWRYDCLHCAEKGVTVLNNFVRTELDRSSYTEFDLYHTSFYFKLPGNETATYCWKFDFRINKTTLTKIELDCQQPLVHFFDEIVNITLDNYQQKTKTCLLFG